MKLTTRAFIAIEIGEGLRSAATKLISRFELETDAIRWVDPANLHYTIKFLGEIPTVELYELLSTLGKGLESFKPFSLDAVGVGAFPTPSSPRTVWLGARNGGDQLTDLHARINETLSTIGYPVEARKFQPHLTLGRVRRQSKPGPVLANLIEEDAEKKFATVHIDEVTVFASELTRRGPKYEILGTCPLKGDSEWT